MDLLKKNKAALDAVSQKLVENESLDADEFKEIMGSKKVSFSYVPVLQEKSAAAESGESKSKKSPSTKQKE